MHTQTTPVWALRTDKHTSIWKLFSMPWPPMDSTSISCFAVPSLEILGHMTLYIGSAPTASHTTKIESCPTLLQDIKQLQRFLGMVNFYRCFLPKCTQVLRPLTNLLKGGPKTLEWTTTAREAFQNSKRLLATAVPLQHPAPQAELSCH